MKKSIIILSLLMSFSVVKAQENVIWKDHNVIFEEKSNDDGVSEYALYSKEVKYEEMYYLLTVSKGDLQGLMDDLVFFGEVCNEAKGVVKLRGSNQIVARDSKSVFVIVEGDLGFAMLQYHEIKKLKKVIKNLAIEKGVDLKINNGLVSGDANKKK